MIKYALIISLASFMLTPLTAQQKDKAKKEEIVFFEDFSSGSLDRARWNVVGPGFHVNDEQQAYVDSTLVITFLKGNVDGAKNGALVIRPAFRKNAISFNGKTFDFLSGRIDTSNKVEFTYGTAAARIKMTDASGLWPAFWALGNGDWPDTGEIDIMEYVGEADWTSVALHSPGYSGDTPLVNKYFFKKGIDATQWHVYSVDWTKDALLFKIDGELIYRATRPMVENYGRWAFDNPKYLILNFALGGAYPAKTNGVKEPYNGLPASTVELIKKGEAVFMVDWVKITK